ncbi:glutathione S-transferase family protein [Rhodosalinus sp. FB01]|uniref:glutathione S-transferase family protein n=1 Tax=Rhodosalinus sp. FB01 TaxID=3239194 RepID=UPI00352623C6
MTTAMERELVLYGGPNSPYARMTRVVGTELSLAFDYRIIDVYRAEFLDIFNPLRQIPTLVVDGRQAIYDSRTIFAFFAMRADRPDFLHAGDMEATTRAALAMGLTDTCFGHRMESIRPDRERSPDALARLAGKLERGLAHMEGMAGDIAAGPVRLEQVVAASMLGYVDYRYGRDWRTYCPGLARWQAGFAARDSMKQSQPYG